MLYHLNQGTAWGKVKQKIPAGTQFDLNEPNDERRWGLSIIVRRNKT